jgi:hypothetical protein
MSSTGRTNAKHISVKLDNAAGTFTDITAYVNNVGTVGLTHETTDVTAFSDGVKNVTIGQPSAPISLSGPFDTTLHTQMTGYTNGGLTAGGGLSLDIYIGIRSAWDTGEPCFGITGSASAGYVLTSYTVSSSGMTWSATLEPFGATAPDWSTSAHT